MSRYQGKLAVVPANWLHLHSIPLERQNGQARVTPVV